MTGAGVYSTCPQSGSHKAMKAQREGTNSPEKTQETQKGCVTEPRQRVFGRPAQPLKSQADFSYLTDVCLEWSR